MEGAQAAFATNKMTGGNVKALVARYEELLRKMEWTCSEYSMTTSVSIANYSHPSESRMPTIEGPNARKGVAHRRSGVFVEKRQGER